MPVPQRLAEELAAAGLTIPAGATVPDWLVDGPEVDMGWLNQFWFLPVVLAQVCPYPVPEGLRAVLEHPLVALNAMVSMACLTGACCLLVPPPEILELDGDGRLHNLDGPVMRWKSGDDEIPDQEVFAVLGVAMDGEVFWSPSPLHICWLGEAGLALLRRRGLDEFLSMLGGWSVGAGRAGETAWRVRVGPVIFDFAPVVTEVASPEGTVVSVAFTRKGPLAIQRIRPDGTREPAVVAHQYGTDKLKMVE